MHDSRQQGGKIMARLDRRRLLKLSGAGAIAAGSGGIAAILASGRAPAYAQTTALHWLRWSDFVPASDQLLRAQIVPECEKALGIKLNLESINANDIQARITSAVQSGSGADIILVVNNWPQLYADSVADGKTVALNSKETVESVRFAVGFWKDAYDEGGLAWDDSSNNRAFLSGTCSSTNNGASIYLEAKKKPETYLTEKGTPLWKDMFHTRLPKGPSGQFSFPFPFSDMVMGYSKNQKAAKEFLTWVHSKPVFDKWFTSQQGFTLGPTAQWQDHPLWQNDPVMLPFRSIADIGRAAGYAGRPSRAAAEVVTKYIITDMYAKAVQGMPAEDAVKWAHAELMKIYA